MSAYGQLTGHSPPTAPMQRADADAHPERSPFCTPSLTHLVTRGARRQQQPPLAARRLPLHVHSGTTRATLHGLAEEGLFEIGHNDLADARHRDDLKRLLHLRRGGVPSRSHSVACHAGGMFERGGQGSRQAPSRKPSLHALDKHALEKHALDKNMESSTHRAAMPESRGG